MIRTAPLLFQGLPGFQMPAPPVVEPPPATETKPDAHGGTFQKDVERQRPSKWTMPGRFLARRFVPALGAIIPEPLNEGERDLRDIPPSEYPMFPRTYQPDVIPPLLQPDVRLTEASRGFDLEVGRIDLPDYYDVDLARPVALDDLVVPSVSRPGRSASRREALDDALRTGRLVTRNVLDRPVRIDTETRLELSPVGVRLRTGVQHKTDNRPRKREVKTTTRYQAFTQLIARPTEAVDTFDALMSGWQINQGYGYKDIGFDFWDVVFGRVDWARMYWAYEKGYLSYDAEAAFLQLAQNQIVDYAIGKASRATQEAFNAAGWSSPMGVQWYHNRLDWFSMKGL